MIKKIEGILNGRAWQSAVGETSVISFQNEVIDACKANYCGMYNTRWTCPPAVGNIEDLKAKYTAYKNFYIFSTLHNIEDSFDFEGMMDARQKHDKIQADLLEELSGEDVEILGVGGCSLCEKCTYPDNPCRFPNRAKPSLESCGISVVELCKTLNINYINGQNTVTYFTAVFFN